MSDSERGKVRRRVFFPLGVLAVLVVLALPFGLIQVQDWLGSSSSAHPYLELTAPREPKEYWEMVTALGTLGVGLIAVYGLRSIRLAKHDIRARLTREALESAVSESRIFANEIIEGVRKNREQFKVENIELFPKSLADVKFAGVSEEEKARAWEWYNRLSPNLLKDCTRVLNDLEAWSMNFTSNIADHTTVYKSCAIPFFSIVVEYYALLVVFREVRLLSGRYPHIVALFEDWKADYEEQQKTEELEAIFDRLFQLEGVPVPALRDAVKLTDSKPQRLRNRTPFGTENID